MKIAKLVYVSLVTRVVVEDSATEDEIIEMAKDRLIDNIKTCLGENIDSIEDDTEVLYDPEFDDIL